MYHEAGHQVRRAPTKHATAIRNPADIGPLHDDRNNPHIFATQDNL